MSGPGQATVERRYRMRYDESPFGDRRHGGLRLAATAAAVIGIALLLRREARLARSRRHEPSARDIRVAPPPLR